MGTGRPELAKAAGPERNSGSTWILYIDGGARGNPGPAGAAAVVYDERGTKLVERRYPLGHLTNNAAEYEGLLRGLELARSAGARQLEVRSDSELLVRQMQGEYKTKASHLKEAVARARALLNGFTSVTFVTIPREENLEADLLANKAMDEIERARKR